MSDRIAVRRLAGLARAFAAIAALVALTAGPAAGSAFPGDNGRIAFQSTRDGGAPEIYSMNPDGTDERRLTNTFAGNYEPSFSADGRRIVFRSNRDGNPEIYVMNADGTGETRITNNAVPDAQPSFTPGGRGIAFARRVDGYFSIWAMNSDGSQQTRLTDRPPFGDLDPTFYPFGLRIAFAGGTGFQESGIFVMDAHGMNQTNLITGGPLLGRSNRRPSFSPDGRTLAVESVEGEPAIFTMNALDGANQTPLLFNATQPAFSPDGRKIAYRGGRAAPEIWVMDRDGSNRAPLTNRAAGTSDQLPNWGPRPRPTAGADVLSGDTRRDVLCGRGGSDVIRGFGGNDTLFGDRCGQQARAAAPTAAAAAAGDDRLFGGRGNDRLFGGARADRLHGGPGRDRLHGEAGGDVLLARDGERDRVRCGGGRDVARVDGRDRVSGCERVAGPMTVVLG